VSFKTIAFVGAVLALYPLALVWRRLRFSTSRKPTATRPEWPRQQLAESGPSKLVRKLDAFLPAGINCLAIAIAARWITNFARVPTTMFIGVSFDSNKHFHSHAWLVSSNRIITGGPLSPQFKVIWTSDTL
jgi:hypothetical protein